MYIKQPGGAVLPNGFENHFSSIREAAPLEKPDVTSQSFNILSKKYKMWFPAK